MALESNALVTWEETKAFLDLTDDEQDKTEFLINAISQRVENVTGRKLNAPAADETKYIDGDASAKILIPEYPVISITSLFLDASRVFGEDTAVEASEYKLDTTAGIITLFEKTTPEGPNTVKIVLKAGYSSIPYDLRQAVFETISWNSARFASGSIGYQNLTGEGMNARPELTIPSSAWPVIQSYRREPCV